MLYFFIGLSIVFFVLIIILFYKINTYNNKLAKLNNIISQKESKISFLNNEITRLKNSARILEEKEFESLKLHPFKFSEIPIRRVNDSSIPDTFVLDEKSQLSGASIFSPMSI